jgi:hypothetical protein
MWRRRMLNRRGAVTWRAVCPGSRGNGVLQPTFRTAQRRAQAQRQAACRAARRRRRVAPRGGGGVSRREAEAACRAARRRRRVAPRGGGGAVGSLAQRSLRCRSLRDSPRADVTTSASRVRPVEAAPPATPECAYGGNDNLRIPSTSGRCHSSTRQWRCLLPATPRVATADVTTISAEVVVTPALGESRSERQRGER